MAVCGGCRKHGLTEFSVLWDAQSENENDRERFEKKSATGVIIDNFSPFSALKRRKMVEKSCGLPITILNLAGWKESKPCPAIKSGIPAFLLRKRDKKPWAWTGLPRPYRETERKSLPETRKKPNYEGFFSVFVSFLKRHNLLVLRGKMETKKGTRLQDCCS